MAGERSEVTRGNFLSGWMSLLVMRGDSTCSWISATSGTSAIRFQSLYSSVCGNSYPCEPQNRALNSPGLPHRGGSIFHPHHSRASALISGPAESV